MTIADIQRALNAAGYGPLAVDNIVGPKTTAALVRYQNDHGLSTAPDQWDKTVAALGGTPVATSDATGEQTFQQKYPQFAWAFADPEISSILQRAVNEKWGPDEVQGAVQNTAWWKNKTDAERNWLQLLATDPKEAERRLNNYDSITKYMQYAAAFGLPMDFQTAARNVDRAVRGDVAPDALTEELRLQAKALYPQLSQQIDAGATVEDIYAPYKQIATSLLGVNDATIRLTDPKWQAPLQYTGRDGQRRLATTDEWMTLLRTDPRFGYDKTSGARQEAAQFATQIGQMFGALS